MKEFPKIGQIVKYKMAKYIILHCDLVGKCKIKKLHLPNKGIVLREIDINELF